MRRVVSDLYGDDAHDRGKVSFSYFEVLGNTCTDCLAPPARGQKSSSSSSSENNDGGAGGGAGGVQIGEGMDGSVITRNLSEHPAPDADALLALIHVAQSRRSTAPTERNAASSRSHGVGIITVGSSLSVAEDESQEGAYYGPRPGVLYVIDLAGSERASDSANHSKERMDETKAVNLSLMSLKECIRARTLAAKPPAPGAPANGRQHVPYRRSKLTMLMKDVFDVECTRMCSTVVVACVSPVAKDAAHTVNTLQYAAPLRVAVQGKKKNGGAIGGGGGDLPVDPKDPVLWSHEAACDWLTKQTNAATGGDGDGVGGSTPFDAAAIIPRLNGREMCMLPEPEFHRRMRSQLPGSAGAGTASKVYGALWALIVDAKTRRRRSDGTILTDEEEAEEVRQAEEALAARAALWAERDKAMARGGF